MDFKLVLSDSSSTNFNAIDERDAVRVAFRKLKIAGRIRLNKFISAGGVAIFCGDKKIFPLP
ncbi:MAG: hypothetical protein HYT62_02020 [Candidatus Yanofskybacteria bacterium]|nr:hypothetical protein [Candidatus Yanofskybacteria bacterium]